MLAAGDRIPNLTLIDASGAPVALASLLERPLVLYFYPKDNTPGCSIQACSFRDDYQAFVERGAEVVGVSSDGSASHAGFAQKLHLPFRLLSDPGGAARSAFGIPKTLGILPGRATFLIDTSGVIRYAFNSQFAPAKHVEMTLAAIDAMQTAAKTG